MGCYQEMCMGSMLTRDHAGSQTSGVSVGMVETEVQ